MSDQIRDLLSQAKTKDFQALAKVLSWVERVGAKALVEDELLNSHKKARRLGVTGPPGAGKSTMIGQLIGHFRGLGLSVGVIAVDPSSAITKGAILADRIRYSEHFSDSEVFIRSLGTRGSLGGLSASAYLMLRVFDLCDFDVVLIETVGVGQSELEIMHVADMVAVALVPESGDAIQAMKAGLLEVADLFVVNKSDRPGADGLVNELKSMVAMGEKDVDVLKTVATTGAGIAEMAEHFLKAQFPEAGIDRLQAEAKALLRLEMERSIDEKAARVTDLQQLRDLF